MRTGAGESRPFFVRGGSAAALVALVAVLASVVGIVNDFASDDVSIILNDERVRSPALWRAIFSSSYWPPPWSPELYRPFTTALLMGQHAFGAGAPVAFRVTSYLLYALVSVAVLRLAQRVLPSAIALGVALLFAAHPVHVEAVAMAVNQAELCVALIAVCLVSRYLDRRRGGGLRARDWGLLAIGYVAASLFKETGLVIPGLLAAAELTLVPGEWRARIGALWRGYGALALCAVLVLLVRRAALAGQMTGTFTAEGLEGLGMGGRALTMLQVVPAWLRLLFLPAHLQADYSPREIVASTGLGLVEAVGLVFVVAIVVIAITARRRAPVVTFGILWMAIALFPVSNVLVPTGIVMAERTLFLPSVGFLIAVGGAIDAVLRRWPQRSDGLLVVPRWLAAACVLLTCAGVARSAMRERDWRNNWVLWYRTATDAPLSYRAQHAFGWVLFQVGQRDAAIEAYQRAIGYSPFPWQIRNDLADELRDRGDDSTALTQLQASLLENPNQPVAKAGLIADLIALGRYDRAIDEAAQARLTGSEEKVVDGLRAVADSAKRAGAPPGSVRLHIRTAPKRAQIGG